MVKKAHSNNLLDRTMTMIKLLNKANQMIGFVKCFDGNQTMSFKINDDNLLKKYTKIWKRISSLMDIDLDSGLVYGDNDKYIKAKIKTDRDQINIISQGKKVQKKMHHTNVYH